MKVLMVHNFYQSSSPSGEDVVFRNEIELLKQHGINVITYTRYNDEIKDYGLRGKLVLPFKNIWSIETYKELKAILKKEKPDIAHFHNIWYLISPSAYYACKEVGIPTVQTIHNFRMFCSSGLLLRDGKICEDCIGKIPWRAMVYGCYKKSILYSTPIALTEIFHKFVGTFYNKVDAYISLTEFAKDKLIQAGLPKDKIYVKPNFLLNPPKKSFSRGKYIAFVGRISEEKGIKTLIDALRNQKKDRVILKLIGDGPMKKDIEKEIKKDNIQNIELLGKRSHLETLEIIRNAKFIVLPSICYEMFPMVLLEAFAYGKPAIGSKLGAIAELIEDGKTGLLFEAGNFEDLAEKIQWMIENEDAYIKMGKNARKVFEEKYTAERNFQILMEIYKKVIERGKD